MKKQNLYVLSFFLILFTFCPKILAQQKNITNISDKMHQSDPVEGMVHQFYAGESAKIWPGWEGLKYKFRITIYQIECFNARVNSINDETIYFKLMINNEWNLLNNNTNYYLLSYPNDYLSIQTEPFILQKEIWLNSYEPLLINLIACIKNNDYGNRLVNDDLLGKKTLVYKNFNNWNNISEQYFSSDAVDQINESYIRFKISIELLSSAGINLDQGNTNKLAQLEINENIGTQVVYDIGNYNMNNRYLTTYSGIYNQVPSVNINSGSKQPLYNIYTYWYTVPYSNYDDFVFNPLEKGLATEDNNDIIEGSHEEDIFNPAFQPNTIWETQVAGRDAPVSDVFYYRGLLYNVSLFENHSWEPDDYNEGSINTGGWDEWYSTNPNASSAQYKAQLYLDTYVLPEYYRNNLNQSYYWLGRIVHLLEDMSSTPHVHRDGHPNGDYFETGVANEYITGDPSTQTFSITWKYLDANTNKCIDFNNISKYVDGTQYGYHHAPSLNGYVEWEEKWGTNGWPADLGTLQTKWKSSTPLFHLFYSMSETTDEYPSNEHDGESFSKELLQEHWQEYADQIMPRMMAHVAGLYRLFWYSTHFPTNNSYSEYLETSNPSISEKMKSSYLNAINSNIYLGSPIDSCLVRKYNETNYYRTYNHGGVFYNSKKSSCYYMSEIAWNKFLTELQSNNNRLGLPISNEYVSNNNTSIKYVEFENGFILVNNGIASLKISAKLLSPLGGESWIVGSSHNILWENPSPELTPNLEIDFSTDGGSSWQVISGMEATANDGEQSWVVPNTVSNNCRLRLKLVSEDVVMSLTPINFSITADANAKSYFNITLMDGSAISKSLGNIQKLFFNNSNDSVKIKLLDGSNLSYSINLIQNISFTSESVAPLPVQIVSFVSSVVNKSQVQLEWITATEINNYGFDIERSTDRTKWIKIGFMSGHGNSNSPKNYYYSDSPRGGSKFYYRLKQIDFNGNYEIISAIEVLLELPTKFALYQNYPNPFNPITKIKFDLPVSSFVKITLYDILGNEIKIIKNNWMESGMHEIIFNGSDLSSGIYIYTLKYLSNSLSRKMIVLK